MPKNDPLLKYKSLKQRINQHIYPVQFSKDINLKLERISHLLDLIGNPQDQYPAIHVGGTSGKGSTATMAASMLSEAGYKTGLHTSPHLQVLNERYQINNKITPTQTLIDLFDEIKPAIDEVQKTNPFGSPSYFEILVAIAFTLFDKERVDAAVVEVGLGGTLDATNVINAQIALITNIGLDHTAILGDTIELITADKAGIIKPKQRVISGVKQPAAQKILEDRCKQQGAAVWQFGRDFTLDAAEEGDYFSVILPDRAYPGLELSLLGAFQRDNAACALAAVHALNSNIPEADIRKGLQKSNIPGRMEVVQENPTVLLDGAHNADKIRAAAKVVDTRFYNRKRHVIFGLKKGKAYSDILPAVIHQAETLIITTFSTELWDPIEPEILMSAVQELDALINITIEPDPIRAVKLALKISNPYDLIWVTGSLYLVGNVRDYWHPPARLLGNQEEIQ